MFSKIASLNFGRVASLAALVAVFPPSASGQSFQVLKTFENLGCPSSDTVRDASGNLYATVACGGQFGQGAVIKIAPRGRVTLLYSFAGGGDGTNPQGSLLQDLQGNLYGTTHQGGTGGVGTIYKVAGDGTYTLLHSLQYSSEGGSPDGGLVSDPAGNLYGTAFVGGPGGEGTVFKLAPDGTFAVLHSFNLTDGMGYLPTCCLVRDANGDLYGTTASGGSGGGPFGGGTLFKLSSDGTYTVLHDFTGGPDGAVPFGLLASGSGDLYGLTQSGGSGGQGVVFKWTPTGNLDVVYSFSSYPAGGLAEDDAGNLYGVNPQGGSQGRGAIFKLTPSGGFSFVYEFTGGNDGDLPRFRPVLDDAGNVYGMTSSAGASGVYGNVYSVAPDGTYSILHTLKLISLNGELSVDSSGTLFGTTQAGGIGFGSVFSFAPVSRSYKEIYSFGAQFDGQSPVGGVILDETGKLFGTASFGGEFGGGTAFKLNKDGRLAALHSFGDSDVWPPDGTTPLAGLAADGSGNLFGTAAEQGPLGGGIAFKLGADGSYTILHGFGFDEGWRPLAGLLVDGSGNVYGTTSEGGEGSAGTVFEIEADGTYSVLHNFGWSDGANPLGALTIDASGNLYGTTSMGGAANLGNVFKLAPDGTLTTLHDFAQADGASPVANLVFDSSGNLYGTTSRGGASNLGTVFKLASDGTYTVLHSFAGVDGAFPMGGLKFDGKVLYGATSSGGPLAGGSLFRLRP